MYGAGRQAGRQVCRQRSVACGVYSGSGRPGSPTDRHDRCRCYTFKIAKGKEKKKNFSFFPAAFRMSFLSAPKQPYHTWGGWVDGWMERHREMGDG